MTHVVEDGTGIFRATSYVGLGFVHSYLHARSLNTAWDAASVDDREAATVAATDYIDIRFRARFLGSKEFLEIAVAESNILDILLAPQNNSTVTIGTTVYRFQNGVTLAYDVDIGATIEEAKSNLIAAIMAGTGEGTAYGTGTLEHPDVTASSAGATTILVESKVTGPNGNIVTISSDEARLSWDTTTLTGGSDGEEQILEWPRLYVYSPSGILVTGIPILLKKATAEYALRALTATLMPDPTIDDSGKSIIKKVEKVGPIVEETEFEKGSQMSNLLRPYPSADRLLSSLLKSAGGTIR